MNKSALTRRLGGGPVCSTDSASLPIKTDSLRLLYNDNCVQIKYKKSARDTKFFELQYRTLH
jgi:hypothetical protein